MPRLGQFLTILVFTILIYLLTGVLAQRRCCRVKGCSIPPDCICPLKKELCKDVSKGILSMGKRTRSYEENVYRQPEQNKDRRMDERMRTNQILHTILELVQREEEPDDVQDWTPSLNLNRLENEELNEDLYGQHKSNFYTD